MIYKSCLIGLQHLLTSLPVSLVWTSLDTPGARLSQGRLYLLHPQLGKFSSLIFTGLTPLSSGSSLTDCETVPAPPFHSLLSYFMTPYNIYQRVEYCVFTCLFFFKCVYYLLPLTFVSSIKGEFCLFTTEGSKICHPKICLLHCKIILSWLLEQTQKKLWKLSSYHFVRGIYI